VPLDGTVAGLRTFDVPLDVAGLPRVGNRLGLLLMEVWIPKEAAPGLHRGTVAILQDGKELARLGVDLTVYPLRLPDRPAFQDGLPQLWKPLSALGLDVRLGNGATGDVKLPRPRWPPSSRHTRWPSTTVAISRAALRVAAREPVLRVSGDRERQERHDRVVRRLRRALRPAARREGG
jgi:hypothetical protein